jgi:hypothetical protein
VITNKTPIEFKNPDVKQDTMDRHAASVRALSKEAQGNRTAAVQRKAAAAERASRTF